MLVYSDFVLKELIIFCIFVAIIAASFVFVRASGERNFTSILRVFTANPLVLPCKIFRNSMRGWWAIASAATREYAEIQHYGAWGFELSTFRLKKTNKNMWYVDIDVFELRSTAHGSVQLTAYAYRFELIFNEDTPPHQMNTKISN